MAEETKRIIEVEAKYETLAQLQKIIEKNKAAIEDLDKSSSAYQKGLAELKGAQREYQQEMRIAVKETTSAKGSYNDMVNQLARLKEAWKQADPKTDAYAQYTRQVKKLKEDLAAMDASIGNYQRNVGNYANSISSIAHMFGSAGSAAMGAVNGIKGMTLGLKALSATPVIGVLTILVSLLTKISGAFKTSEEAGNRLAVAMAPLKAGGDLVKIAFEGLANALAGAAEWLGKVADKLGFYNERAKENQALAKEDITLRNRQRAVTIENAKLELESAKARNIAADKANYSVAERIKALEAAEVAEKKILDNELEIAQKQFEIAKRKAALTPNDIATNDALAASEAKLYQVETQYEQGMRRITSQHSAAIIEMRGVTAAAEKEAEALTKLTAIQDGWLNKMDNGVAKLAESRKLMAEEAAATNAMIAEQDKELTDDINATSAELNSGLLANIEAQQKASQQMVGNVQKVASSVSSILDSVAGAYQNEIKSQVESGKISEEEGEKQFQRVKALQYANTWINTLSAAVSAMAEPELPFVVKLANAAAATTAGIANTIKIANTSLGSTTTSSATGSGVQSATTVTTAPQVAVSVPEYRTITTASDEAAINQRTSAQKVVLVTSELEEHNAARKVTLSESTF